MENSIRVFNSYLINEKKSSNNTIESYMRDILQFSNFCTQNNIKKIKKLLLFVIICAIISLSVWFKTFLGPISGEYLINKKGAEGVSKEINSLRSLRQKDRVV